MLDTTKASIANGTILLNSSIRGPRFGKPRNAIQATAFVFFPFADAPRVAKFFQNVASDSTPPNNVVKIVESANKMWPARLALGGIHMHELNSVLPAIMKG